MMASRADIDVGNVKVAAIVAPARLPHVEDVECD